MPALPKARVMSLAISVSPPGRCSESVAYHQPALEQATLDAIPRAVRRTGSDPGRQVIGIHRSLIEAADIVTFEQDAVDAGDDLDCWPELHAIDLCRRSRRIQG